MVTTKLSRKALLKPHYDDQPNSPSIAKKNSPEPILRSASAPRATAIATTVIVAKAEIDRGSIEPQRRTLTVNAHFRTTSATTVRREIASHSRYHSRTITYKDRRAHSRISGQSIFSSEERYGCDGEREVDCNYRAAYRKDFGIQDFYKWD
ncbi:hypothetical protein BDD12DRAFT_897103 [Trichophaea hybrida]|nr:hypothetical protein BDD12DRAFT_897103 [Trichophaea hybrida]